MVLATRVVADFLIGNAPFYELSRYDDTSAIGGSRGVRGVPAQRYHGKIKLIANAELRSELLELRVLGAKRRFGLVAFNEPLAPIASQLCRRLTRLALSL